MLVQGWNVVDPPDYDAEVTIESMRSVKLSLKHTGSGTDLNVYIANGKTYVSTSGAPDNTVTLYGVWLPDKCDAANKDSMLVPLELLSPNVSVDFKEVIKAIEDQTEPVTREEMTRETKAMTELLTNINSGIIALPKRDDISSLVAQVPDLLTTENFNNIMRQTNNNINALQQDDISDIAAQVPNLLATDNFDQRMRETNANINALQKSFNSLQTSFKDNNTSLQATFATSLDQFGQIVARSMAQMTQQVANLLTADVDGANQVAADAASAATEARGRVEKSQQTLEAIQDAQLASQSDGDIDEENLPDVVEETEREKQRKQQAEKQAKERAEKKKAREKAAAKQKREIEEEARLQAELKSASENANTQPKSIDQAQMLIATLNKSNNLWHTYKKQQLQSFCNISANNTANTYRTAFSIPRVYFLPWFEEFLFLKTLDIQNIEERSTVLNNAWFTQISNELLRQKHTDSARWNAVLFRSVSEQRYFFEFVHMRNVDIEQLFSYMGNVTEQNVFRRQINLLVGLCRTYINIEKYDLSYDDYEQFDFEYFSGQLSSDDDVVNSILQFNEPLRNMKFIMQRFAQDTPPINRDDEEIVIKTYKETKIAWLLEFILRWGYSTAYKVQQWLIEMADVAEGAYKEKVNQVFMQTQSDFASISQFDTEETQADYQEALQEIFVKIHGIIK